MTSMFWLVLPIALLVVLLLNRQRAADITAEKRAHALELQQFLTSKTEQLRVILADGSLGLGVQRSRATNILGEMEARDFGSDPELRAFIADTKASIEKQLNAGGAA